MVLGRTSKWAALALCAALSGPASAAHRRLSPVLEAEARRMLDRPSAPGAPTRRLAVLVRLRDPSTRALAPSDRDEPPRLRRRRLGRQAAERFQASLDRPGESLWIANTVAVDLPPADLLELRGHPDVEHVYPDVRLRALPRPVPGPPPPGAAPRAPRAASARAGWGIASVGAAHLHAQGWTGRGVTLGHIDTGVDPSHPHLAGRVVAFRDFVGEARSAHDDHGHGTHTLGIMLGGGAGASVAPEARALVAKALDQDGEGTMGGLLAAMQWMLDPDGDPSTEDQPRAVNCSWGIPRASLAEAGLDDRLFWDAVSAWREAGILPVFSSGNEGADVDVVPAAYPHALAVGAVDRRARVARFSSGGRPRWDGGALLKPDLTAPGVAILSADRGGRFRLSQGTSQASPHVAGLVALLAQARPGAELAALEAALLETAADRGPAGPDPRFGRGLVNGRAAFARLTASGQPSPPPATRPPPGDPTPDPQPPEVEPVDPPAADPPETQPRPPPPQRPPPAKPRRTVTRTLVGLAAGVAAILGLGALLLR